MSRPEHTAPPEIFYNEKESKKYTYNSHMIDVQNKLASRCLELLNLPFDSGPKFILDLGCGSGLSGQVLEENGHFWVGLDISKAMLDICADREVEGDIFQWDMGHGLSFRPGVFDAAISVSALQWLCNADTVYNIPIKRITKFFQSLYSCLARGARAVFQVYPEDPKQMELLTSCAMKAGFTGGLVVDYPHSTRAKKYYLCLFAGVLPNQKQPELPPALTGMEGKTPETIKMEWKRRRDSVKNNKVRKPLKGSKDWVLNKKERQRKLGKEVRPDTKYTGRKRKPKI
eukprot:TRINITY_DN2592_c0_g2_i1.p1 TRINITY_DN2592_c0_g2~~TRINITY_DN2592_c0_g2_i1.p1  ORF type:complete len:302 (+),score=65.98 TRINITY_DN2592_c0_g2_i1:50-907(+)